MVKRSWGGGEAGVGAVVKRSGGGGEAEWERW